MHQMNVVEVVMKWTLYLIELNSTSSWTVSCVRSNRTIIYDSTTNKVELFMVELFKLKLSGPLLNFYDQNVLPVPYLFQFSKTV